MDRREFLTVKPTPRGATTNAKTVRLSATGIQPFTGTFDTAQLIHLLKRTMFGAAPADIAFFKGNTVADVVNYLLRPNEALPDPPLKEYVSTGALVPDDNIATGTTWVNDPNTDGTITSRRKGSLKKWWTGLMIKQNSSIRERMTLFWHNHFATEFADIGDSQFLYKHHALLRANALGNFKTLVREISTDPAMLVYLNGNASTGTSPNENYARELQELFTLGKENNPNYTEADVKAAARALTGWQTSSATISSLFTLSRHDKTAKVFSGFFNTTIPANAAATSGVDDLNALLEMIFKKKEEVSRFIVKKIYRFFCYYDIDQAIETNVILPLAKIFVDSNWEIQPVLSALFKSEHFYDENLRGSLIKSPVEMTIGMIREFNMSFPEVTETTYGNAYALFEYIRGLTAPMGQSIGDPRDVAGWPAYYQTPQFHEIWLNADTLPKRNRFTDLFVANGYTLSGNAYTIKIDVIGFTRNLSSPGNPNQLLIDAFDILLQVPVSESVRNAIKKQILLSGQITDSYWTDAWNAYLANPVTTGTPYKTVESRLKTLYKYLMNLPEYQLS
jgi:uncharacterized protein (DUF1800 family)